MSENIAVEIHGNGDPVVMVHGLGGTSNVYFHQAEILAKYYKVIRPDLPGSGRTPASGPLSIASLAQSVLSVIDAHAGQAVHLVGHSMGTIVCQHVAVMRPDAVRSLALIGPLAAPPEAARGNVRARAAKARAEGMVPIADMIVQGGTSAATKASRPEAAGFVRELLMRQDPEAYALSCEALADAQPAPVERLNIPALLLTGSEDAVTPPPAVAVLAARFSTARTIVLEGCGHWATVECPRQVTEALLNFYFS